VIYVYYSPENEASDELRLVAHHDVRKRREMVRSAALRVIDLGADLEREIDGLRDQVRYYKLGPKDRGIFRQAWHSIRDIVRVWPHATDELAEAFRAGAITPHRLISRIDGACEAAQA
jgi:hypothetical protein